MITRTEEMRGFRAMKGMARLSLLVMVVFAGTTSVMGQVATTPGPSAKKPARVTIAEDGNQLAAPQVVTILHRLNGLKLFRLMTRENQKLLAIAQLDEAFKIMGDVHTNVIAGLAMNDGQTIVARLPEVEAELDSPRVDDWFDGTISGAFANSGAFAKPSAPPNPSAPAIAATDSVGQWFDQPNVTVVARDGRRYFARFVGLDGVTGLSVLTLVDKASVPLLKQKVEKISVGQHLRLVGPEPIAPKVLPGNVQVRIGEIEGIVTNVTSTYGGSISKMKIRSPQITTANIGVIALDDAGQTVGIVDDVQSGEASLISAVQISNAAKRVLEREASVPRPWLGVSGEPIQALGSEDLVNVGWQKPQAAALTQERCGILLTAVAPNSPASTAALRSGDVILQVNGEDIRSADDFSWVLAETGPGNSATFTIMRPGQQKAENINLKLAGAFSTSFPASRSNTSPLKRSFLMAKGIETIALKQAVAARFGANNGLLVIYVQPESQAFKAGLRAGDVIETINGRAIPDAMQNLENRLDTELKFEVVRRKERIILTVSNKPQ